MKTIYVARSEIGWIDIYISAGRAGATHEVEVLNSNDNVATVAVYPDGDAEVVWRSGAETYRDRSAGWWADLAAEVAKAVAS